MIKHGKNYSKIVSLFNQKNFLKISMQEVKEKYSKSINNLEKIQKLQK